MKKVIFICKGNQFRSPIAKALYNKYKKDDSVAESYGFAVEEDNKKYGLEHESKLRSLPDYPELNKVIETLKKKEGIDNSNEVRKQLTPNIVKSADQVVFMDIDQVPEEYKNKGYIYWNVKDYDFLDQKIAEDRINEIKKLVLVLVK